MTDQIIEARIIGDTGHYLDMKLNFHKIEEGRNNQFWLRCHPGLDVVKFIKENLCSPDCDCLKHEFYRIRDIYSDGNPVLEIHVQRIK